jgi:histidinol dehydrogenase
MLRIIDWSEASEDDRSRALSRPLTRNPDHLRDSVSRIIDAVRRDGDKAIRELSARFDGHAPASLAVGADELAEAAGSLDAEEIAAIDLAIANVRRFHEAQVPSSVRVETMPGVVCERISHPLGAVGLYVPAGTAPLPSAAVMLGVPAVIAGCPRIVLCTPPRADGKADPAVLIAAARAGVTDVFKAGGAQAIAGMAFGTSSIPRVDKIFGPGSAWVTEAKTQVAALSDGAAIDMPAGPSEVLVIADASASAEFVAADLLSQAEHGADSQVVLITDSARQAEQVIACVRSQLDALDRADIAADALGSSVAIVVGSISEAIDLSNDYAPEHLILQVRDARKQVARIRNAGSVFLGPWSPESAGDYCSGTNHVLPTYGHARAYSGLSVDQFMRQMTVQELSRDGLRSIAGAIVTLAKLEGLDAHARAVTLRLADQDAGR